MASQNPNHQFPLYTQYQTYEQPPIYQPFAGAQQRPPQQSQPQHGLGYPPTIQRKYSPSVPQQTFQSPPQYAPQYAPPYAPQYGASTPAPPTLVAELPAALPQAPPTTTSSQQLNEDQLLAQRLQNMEIEEARRRSSSNVSMAPSIVAPQELPASTPQASQIQELPASIPHRSTQTTLSQQITQSPPSPPGPPLPTRPHSESLGSSSFYGPDSFGPPPVINGTSDGRTLMAHPDIPPPTPQDTVLSMPEVVAGPRPLSVSSALFPTPRMQTSVRSSQTAAMSPASLASYLEVHREVPIPARWRLPPVTETLYASSVHAPKQVDWLDMPLAREWRTVRTSQHIVTPTPPTYSFAYKCKGGALRGALLDARLAWTMSPGPWTYNLKIDSMTGIRKSELLRTPSNMDLITTYIQAPNYDSLRFIGPDGRQYLWVAHAPLSSTNGARYDTLRHALFVAPRGRDPLYGELVADHAYWDGFIDHAQVHRVACAGCGASPINGLRWKCKECTAPHDLCELCRVANKSVLPKCSFSLANLPDEALYIRSTSVDTALVVATLQVLKDWELHALRAQRKLNPDGFRVSEDLARKGDLGKVTYWKAEDVEVVPVPVPAGTTGEVKVAEPVKGSKDRAKEQKAREKLKAKEAKERAKKKDSGEGLVGIKELVRGSAQIGGAQIGEDVGDIIGSEQRISKESRRS